MTELVREVTRARVQVRLEEDEHAAAGHLARRRDRRCNLRRVMRVVVVDEDAAGLTAQLEPARRAFERRDVRLRFLPIDSAEFEGGESRSRVAPVVLAAQRKVELDGLELLGANDVSDVRGPLVEERLNVGA